jgi:predicted metal-dependent phosphoesterase TrpH
MPSGNLGLMLIDLHSHSTRSDGKESPTEVFEQAALAGVNILALTDHDTTSGWAEASVAAKRLGLGFVPGIEVTTRARVDRGGRDHFISVHMLAYLPDPNHVALAGVLGDSVSTREVRAKAMVDLLALDYDITWDLVLEQLTEGATIGRPALADALVALGVVSHRSEAFESILSKNGGYYIPAETADVFDAISLIREAGGVPVIAHPLGGAPDNLDRGDLPQEHFEMLIAGGLAGFEVYHREVPEVAREWLLGLASKHDLIVTGSSDYHGVHGKPNRLGENSTAPEMFERIIALGSGTQAQL